MVRCNQYSVPARFIGHRLRVKLSASAVTVYDRTSVVARHQRAIGKGAKVLDLDHYLEILYRKPGALPGATALVQARAAKKFTAEHDAFWAAARKAHGDAAGTRALVEVLLLHRHLDASRRARRDHRGACRSARPTPTWWRSKPARPPSAAEPPALVETRRRGRPGGDPGRASLRGRARRCPAAALGGQVRRPARAGKPHDPRGARSPSRPRPRRSSRAAACCGCPTIRDRFAEIAAAAEREQLSYLGFLAELVIAECDDRDPRRAERRIRDAGFPRPKRLEEFAFDANPAINPAVIGQLASCAWVKAGHPLCLIGDSGTGKTHLLIALGTAGRRSRLPGPLHPGHQAGQRTRRSRRRQAADQADHPLRPRRSASASTSWATCSWTGAAPSCCSKSSPNARNARPSRSPPTSRSPPGPRPSPTRGSARPSSTGSPSPGRSSKPAPPPTGWPTPASDAPPADHDQ